MIVYLARGTVMSTKRGIDIKLIVKTILALGWGLSRDDDRPKALGAGEEL
jgi:hypothetical protein